MKYFINLLKNLDKALIILVVAFAIISIVMIGSTAYDNGFIFTRDVIVQAVAYGLGFICLLFVIMIDYKTYEHIYKWIYGISIAFLLTVYIPGLGLEQYGARSWIDLKVTTLQPSEFVKITFIILMAVYLSKYRDTLNTLWGIIKAALFGAPFIVIVLKEDLGSAIVFCVIWVCMVFFAGIDYKLFAKLAAIFILMIPLAYRFMASHQKDRIDAFMHPDNLSLPGNYQVFQSKIAIGSGGLFGKGLFQGTQKGLDFLPVQKSDFIFSVICEELGLIGGLILIILFTIFLYRMAVIAKNSIDLYGALIAVGFIGSFGFQIFENIAMSMGIMPVTGITLPFISSGGSSILSSLIGLGLVLSVGMRSKSINF
ncbi:MAG: rod shape-determining protein RodA [Firmicutes bacterium]|nr:rod shape-determining protein RodA [Bacillota bacterium]